MFFKYWPVLFVDDEPDVLSISKLAVKNFEVYGLPLKIYTAASKAEAIQLLNDNAEVACSLAVAFLDVVMDGNHAGLELCNYIRNDMGNKITQIFIRTGQAGLAPEREVIDKYDINGYFSKVEMTQNKLYSVVKSSVRQYLAYGMAQATIELSNKLIAAMGSRRKILYAVHSVASMNDEQADTPRWLIMDDKVLFSDEVDADRAAKLLGQLRARPGVPLNPYGDKYIKDDEGYQLIQVAGRSSKAETAFLFKSRFAPPDSVINMMHSFTAGLAIAWQQSKDDSELLFVKENVPHPSRRHMP
jgi:CheY-like chemotaxis protein